ncbi:hypothetical protein [Actinobacillus vicugnae]|uniref:hypothetical protein n=1 Tax=Actinobacillus vicugnae TaxID=2573093 RepID=UPI001240D8F6|nr:hypothetical protein [Actinobacillus vicugnae]
MGLGYGEVKESQTSRTTSGINTALTIQDKLGQLEKTGKTAEEVLAQAKTAITTENAESYSGKLANHFDKDLVQKELDVQVKAMKDFQEITLPQVNSYVSNKVKEYEKEAKQLEKAGKIEEATVAQGQARNW